MPSRLITILTGIVLCSSYCLTASGQDGGSSSDIPLRDDPPGMQRLSPKYNLWIDPKGKRVVTVGKVVLTEGALELFACMAGTKEHESIVAVPTEAKLIHAGLLAVGAEAGNPVQFRPEYIAARGDEIEIQVFWTDENGQRQQALAQDWIRNTKTEKAMDVPFVFGGSGFWEDTQTGERYYLAEDGDLICVANFPSAMLDVPVESSQSDDLLIYEALSERIPPVGTEVTLVLTPKKKPMPPQQ